jgi:hypothetical protein
MTWICPGCGVLVTMPRGCRRPAETDDAKLDKLAQILCGCWVLTLSDAATHRLLTAIIHARDPKDARRQRRIARA